MRLLAAALLLMPMAIVRRADVPDERYVALGAALPAVISVGRAGDATLIADRWLITAAHVARSVGSRATIRIGTTDYSVDRVVVHPSWRERGEHDIALLRLARSVTGVKAIPMYRGSRERGLVATLVGHGATGTGDSRRRIDDGRRRAATSLVDSASAHWLYFSFDSPPRGTTLEGAPGRGDSGGPAVITIQGKLSVAGISSAGFDGRSGPGTYGAVDAYTRVSTHAAWIDSVMSSPHVAATRGKVNEPGRISNRVLPNTPLGKRYAAFLSAVKANNDAAMRSFVRDNFDAREIGARPALVPNLRRIAGLLQNAVIDDIVRSDETALAVRFRGAAGLVTIELVSGPAQPHRLIDWRRYD